MLEFVIANYGWLSIGAFGLLGAGIGHIADRIIRPLALSPGKRCAAIFLCVAVLGGGAMIGANRWLTPYLEEQCCRERVIAWLTQSPTYSTLIAHHPDAKSALISAGVKMGMGGSDAIVGQAEFSAVLNHYLRRYLPVTSDAAAREFVMATTAIVDEMFKTEPELCVDLLNGENRKMVRRLPPHVFRRYGDAVGRIITDGILNPQTAPDRRYVHWQQRRVREQMARDGNPLARDPKRLMGDPNRACFALLAIFDAVSKTVPQDEIGAFLRGTIPDYLKDDET